jgi:cob(I)alamin adenosyltransferase
MEKEIAVLLEEQIDIEEIVAFIAKTRKYPRKFVEERIQRLLENWQQGGFTYKVFADKEQEEKEYFLKMSKVKTIEELAEVFAEMAVMLERALVLNAFYSEKLKRANSRAR